MGDTTTEPNNEQEDFVPIYKRFVKHLHPPPKDFKFPPVAFPRDPKLENPVYLNEQVGYAIQEKYVAQQETIEIRNKMRECWWKNGVNAFELCRELADDYSERLRYPLYYLPKEVRDEKQKKRVQKLVEQKRKQLQEQS